MLDSPEGVCAGQARFEYPATSVLFSNSMFYTQIPEQLSYWGVLDRPADILINGLAIGGTFRYSNSVPLLCLLETLRRIRVQKHPTGS
jgi:hypothetical protein